MKHDFVPARRGAIDAWEANFVLTLANYATVLGIPATQVADIGTKVQAHRQAYQDALQAKKTAKSKVNHMQTEQVRTIRAIRKLVRQIKASPNYTDVIGASMGIIGPEMNDQLPPPVLKVQLIGGRPVISYRKKQSHGIFLHCKRGVEQQLTLLAIDTRSPYVDTRPNLNPSQPEERHYAAFYMLHDSPVGQMGPIVSIVIGAT